MTANKTPALPFSLAREAGGLVFLSGQLGLDSNGNVVPGGVTAQTQAIFDRIEVVLADRGLTLANIVKATIWLTEVANFGEFNRAYASRLGTPFPARSTVVSALVLPDALVEIEIIAALPEC